MDDEHDWEYIAHLSNQFHPYHKAARLFGTGQAGVDKLFSGGLETTTPWQKAGRQKKTGLLLPDEEDAVATELRRSPPMLRDVDPRALHSTQPSIVQHHLSHYMGSRYDLTGETSADSDNIGNRFPVILNRPSRSQRVILSGHHRATAALLKGRPLRALYVEGQ